MKTPKGEKASAKSRTSRLVGLFVAASLLVASGCSHDRVEICYDDDSDGRCDDDLSEVDKDSYVVVNGRRTAYIKSSDVADLDFDYRSRVSSGSRGGIGKSSGFSGG